MYKRQDYASGRSYQLDTAARMCVNTASGQIAAQVSDSNILNNGITLVRVSEHWGARDKGEGIQNHKEWQGKVYSIDGEAYPEEERRIGMETVSYTQLDVYKRQVHVFRRTFATRLADAGCPLEVIQELMGHSKPETTQRYIAKSQARVVQSAARYFNAA